MKALVAIAALLALARVAHGDDVYAEVQALSGPVRDGEPYADAVVRWKRGVGRLDAVDRKSLPDYRHCALVATLEFRLHGPRLAAQRSYACTSALIDGTVAAGGPVLAVGQRARIINQLGKLVADDYQATVDRLIADNARLTAQLKARPRSGSVTFGQAMKQIDKLQRKGTISKAEAAALREQLEDALQADAAVELVPAPFDFDFDPDQARLLDMAKDNRPDRD